VAWIGAVTALLAATIATSQYDIKKVLAYSTVSQLGLMFVAMGVGAYAAGMAHVVTHAFFKACLFLGSGSVIHAMHHEQDMRKMGGLKKHMPTTYWTFLVSTLALAGFRSCRGSGRRTRSSGWRTRARTAGPRCGPPASPSPRSRPATCSGRST
jgi:NADH-quinone oxidoreductase subunit L